jgi:hypothetical protein
MANRPWAPEGEEELLELRASGDQIQSEKPQRSAEQQQA